MPTTPTLKNIRIKVTNGTKGEYVTIWNSTKGERVRKELGTGADVVYNPANDDYTWAKDDVIYAEIQGRINQINNGTITAGGVSITLSNSANTSIPDVSL